MAIRDLFSKRAARAARAGKPDVYQYEDLPRRLRVQIVHIWQRAIGDFMPHTHSRFDGGTSLWAIIEQELAEEFGVFRLGPEHDAFERLGNFFLKAETAQALDTIEAVFNLVDQYIRPDLHYAQISVKQLPDDAIADLNQRFREHSVGYQYVEGQLLRVDSEYLHAEAVLPALVLLADPAFSGPQDEFLRAHKHYREGKNKESINEALKALESSLKTICAERGWKYDKDKDTAKTLIDIVLKEGLVPAYLQTAFGGLRSVLEGIVPTARNRTSGHGQGPEPKAVPVHFAAYVLHVTAATILFLVELHRAKR